MKKRGVKTKKAQVTLFILIGVVILFASAIYFYVQNKEQVDKLGLELVRVQEAIEQQAPVDYYVEQCVKKIGTEAFELAGYQGGHVYINENEFNTNCYDPTECDLFMHDELKVPYWNYLRSRNTDPNIVFSSKRPSLLETEEQVSDYVETELNRCLDDFKVLEGRGYNFEILGQPKIRTKVRSNDIILELNYPFTTRKGGEEKEYELFYSTLNINFKDIYNLATEITEAEINYVFLERFTNTVLSSLGSLDTNLGIPPRYISSFGATAGIWIQHQVKQRIQESLTIHFPYIRIPYTSNDVPIEIEVVDPYTAITQAMVNSMVFNILESDYNDVSVELYYLNWPSYIKINDGEAVLEPSSLFSTPRLLRTIGLGQIFQEYDFSFDVSYPVLLVLRNEDSLFGKGYSFYFALESNIRDNHPLTNNSQIVRFETGRESTIACRPSQMRSGEVTVITKDKITGESLEDVQIEYSCANLFTCFSGSTELINDSAMFKGKLNINCVEGGGYLTATKPGYQPFSVSYTATPEDSDTIEIEIYPLKEVEIRVMKRTKDDLYNLKHWTSYMGSSTQSARLQALEELQTELGEYDETYLSLQRHAQETGEHEFETFMMFEANSSETKTISLIPGTYSLSSQLIYLQPMNVTTTIPAIECSWWQEWVGGCEERDEEVITMELDSAPIGGAELNVTITDDLNEADNITFYIMTPEDIPSTSEELSDALNLGELSEEHESSLRPVLR
ncbi:hypothetical protein HQ529_06235 [Candidatus Woesearchaeota archaeon]|nr:hypothetical protein [Candidatus Woesearchaeota archaeon]